MNKSIICCTAIACLAGTPAAIAADLPEEILVCRTVADAVERAACYDRVVDALSQPAEVPSTVATSAPTQTTPPMPPTLPTTPEPSPAVVQAPAPSQAPVAVSPPEPVQGSAAETPVSRENQVRELEALVTDLEQQVAVLAQGSAQQTAEPVSSEELFGKDESASRDIISKLLGLGQVEQIEATLSDVKRTPYGKLRMVLDNGQIWTQLDNGRLTVKAGDGVVIKSANLGSFLLEKRTGSLSIRVKRVD